VRVKGVEDWCAVKAEAKAMSDLNITLRGTRDLAVERHILGSPYTTRDGALEVYRRPFAWLSHVFWEGDNAEGDEADSPRKMSGCPSITLCQFVQTQPRSRSEFEGSHLKYDQYVSEWSEDLSARRLRRGVSQVTPTT